MSRWLLILFAVIAGWFPPTAAQAITLTHPARCDAPRHPANDAEANFTSYDSSGPPETESPVTSTMPTVISGRQVDAGLRRRPETIPPQAQDVSRFWTMDTDQGGLKNPLSLHKYSYCQENPVNCSDPLGPFVRYTTAGGMTYVIGDTYSDLTNGLQSAINKGDLITDLTISGHGDNDLISLDRFGDYLLVGTFNAIVTGDNDDITKLLKSSLTSDAIIHLNGCHTGANDESGDNIAKAMSRLLPGRIVTGQLGFAVGPTGNLGFNYHDVRYEFDIGGLDTIADGYVLGRKAYYKNGKLIDKGWLWEGF